MEFDTSGKKDRAEDTGSIPNNEEVTFDYRHLADAYKMENPDLEDYRDPSLPGWEPQKPFENLNLSRQTRANLNFTLGGLEYEEKPEKQDWQKAEDLMRFNATIQSEVEREIREACGNVEIEDPVQLRQKLFKEMRMKPEVVFKWIGRLEGLKIPADIPLYRRSTGLGAKRKEHLAKISVLVNKLRAVVEGTEKEQEQKVAGKLNSKVGRVMAKLGNNEQVIADILKEMGVPDGETDIAAHAKGRSDARLEQWSGRLNNLILPGEIAGAEEYNAKRGLQLKRINEVIDAVESVREKQEQPEKMVGPIAEMLAKAVEIETALDPLREELKKTGKTRWGELHRLDKQLYATTAEIFAFFDQLRKTNPDLMLKLYPLIARAKPEAKVAYKAALAAFALNLNSFSWTPAVEQECEMNHSPLVSIIRDLARGRRPEKDNEFGFYSALIGASIGGESQLKKHFRPTLPPQAN